ncbi:MAG: hypothetical protein KDB26_05445 [Microthrixaceae bacterium]|nr:hypothetical protein [Microthrixaceae bacterium]
MRYLIERKLKRVSTQLASAREDLRVTAEHIVHFAEIEDDTRLRSIVSDSPLEAHEYAEARGDLAGLIRRRDELVAEIARLERRQDELLDEWNA